MCNGKRYGCLFNTMDFIVMIKKMFVLLLYSSIALAGFPPTTSKVSGDTSNITTFNYQFPNFTGTHTGTTVSLGVNSVLGGGTGQTTYTDGQLLIGNSSNSGLDKATLSAGSNITITNGHGTISIAASAAPAAANITSQNTGYTAVANDYVICSGASFTVTLPTAVGISGQIISILHNGTNFSQVYTLNTTSGQTIGGIASGSYALYTNGELLVVVSDGANWRINQHETAVAATSYTPTFSNLGTVTSITAYYSRVGDSLYVNANFHIGTVVGSTASMTLPSGPSISTTKLVSTANNTVSAVVGNYATNGSGIQGFVLAATATDATLFYFGGTPTSANSGSPVTGSGAFTSNDLVTVRIGPVPITGWQP